MGNIFGASQTPQQLMDACIDTLQDGGYALKNEISNLQREEKQTKIDLKKEAKKGKTPMATQMIKNIVRLQNMQAKFYQMSAQLKDIESQIRTMNSVATMQECMKGAARAMFRLNQQVSMPAIAGIMKEFEKQSGIMDMKSEAMQDVMDGVMHQDGDEEKEEEMMNKVMDEIGIQFAEQVKTVPVQGTAQHGQSQAPMQDDEQDDIALRFKAFKNDAE